MPKLSPADRDELMSEARAFIHSRAFAVVFNELETMYVNALKSSNVGDLPAATAHASLRVLEDVKAQLQLVAQQRIP